MSKRGGLERGLRKRTVDVRLHAEHEARVSEAAQGHAMALEALREWHQRRIEQALQKCSDKPLAKQGLEKILPIAKRVPLRPETVKFLMAAERCLAAGVDIEDRPQKQRQRWGPIKRPDWMRDPALLPKRPPGKMKPATHAGNDRLKTHAAAQPGPVNEHKPHGRPPVTPPAAGPCRFRGANW